MSTKARLYNFLIEMKRTTIDEVPEPYRTEIIEASS